ncbi:hypothetical protein H0R92_05100 [Treponema sp. OMZ 840]|uniref:hypothetical protein n=1 Tax=Treponema sp. OMZ 840 TaxID=244313 RepID=UPI003D91280B
MKTKAKKSICALCTFISALCFFSCASMQVQGKSPVERALSAASLLLDGKISDSYIRVYKNEMGKAEVFIADMLRRAEADPLVYADIADNVGDWIMLYTRVELLQKRYGTELRGKKEGVRFDTINYDYLRAEAPKKATDALYAKALAASRYSSAVAAASQALPSLRRAKKYSNHLDAQINNLGAELCYAAAESLVVSEKPDSLLKASEYYAQAGSWIAAYKDSREKSVAAKEKAVLLYLADGRAKVRLQNYAAFRLAKKDFIQAEKIIPGSAAHELADLRKKLTLKVAVVFGGLNSRYPDEQRVRRALEDAVASSAMGPDNLDVRFVRETGRLSLLFADFDDADLVLIGADDLGKVKEVYGPVETLKTAVSATVNGIVYTGTVTEQRQKVTVFFRNNTILYDMRSSRKKTLTVFEEEAHKTSKVFISRIYQGDAQAKPADFDAGGLYVPGAYNRFFPNFISKNDDWVPLTQSAGRLNDTGKKLCWIISNLQYEGR